MDFLLKAVKQTECPQIREDAWWTLINLAARKPLAKFDLMKDVLNFFCGDLKSIEQLSDKIFIDCLTILCQYFGKYIMKATIQLVTKYNLFYFLLKKKKISTIMSAVNSTCLKIPYWKNSSNTQTAKKLKSNSHH